MGEPSAKAVVIDLDFVVPNGAKLLFESTAAFLQALDGIPFDRRIEAEYLAGAECEEGLRRYFAVVKTKKTYQKAARDIQAAFAKALEREMPALLGQGVRNFIKVCADRGVKVILVTRANVEAVAPAFEGVLGDNVILYQEASTRYGGVKGDSWRHAAFENNYRASAVLVVAGTGFGVKAALSAGMASMAVVNEHVAYQDFGGADEIVDKLDSAAARSALGIMRL